MKNLLAIDTTSQFCSVALSYQDEITHLTENTSQSHTQHILDMLASLLQQNDVGYSCLDGIVVNNGPGSFTGLRIGLSVAQGIAYAQNLPVAAINALLALTQQVSLTSDGYVLPVLDARMREVYFALYEQKSSALVCIQEATVCSASECVKIIQQLETAPAQLTCLGNGLAQYDELLQGLQQTPFKVSVTDRRAIPNARDLINTFHSCYQTHEQAALLQSPELLLAHYVRNNVTS